MLHSINLLPWRETKREEHKRRFVQLLFLGVLMGVGLQWGAGMYLSTEYSKQQDRLSYLQSHISKLDKQIASLKIAENEHQSIMTRLEMIENLQKDRNKTTLFMNLMPQLIPTGVYVDKIKMSGFELEISGISDSTARLATMLDNLERSEYLSDVKMHSIVHNKERFGKAFQTFNVSFLFVPTSEEEEVTNG